MKTTALIFLLIFSVVAAAPVLEEFDPESSIKFLCDPDVVAREGPSGLTGKITAGVEFKGSGFLLSVIPRQTGLVLDRWFTVNITDSAGKECVVYLPSGNPTSTAQLWLPMRTTLRLPLPNSVTTIFPKEGTYQCVLTYPVEDRDGTLRYLKSPPISITVKTAPQQPNHRVRNRAP